MPQELSFTTFLKVALLPSTASRAGTIDRLHSGEGGYDFYKRLKAAAQNVALDKTAAQAVLDSLATIKRPSEREHNLLMAKRFLKWWEGLDGAKAFLPPPKGAFTIDGLKFRVRLRPELCYKHYDRLFVTYLYATKNPVLTRHVAGEGLFMLRDQFAKGPWENATFQILDLRQERVFNDIECVTNRSPGYLHADLAFIDTVWPSPLTRAA